jgi:hypothetical protein
MLDPFLRLMLQLKPILLLRILPAGRARMEWCMPQDAILSKLISEATTAREPVRRTAAALLLSTVRRENPFGGPTTVIRLNNPGLSPNVLAAVEDLAGRLGIDSTRARRRPTLQ